MLIFDILIAIEIVIAIDIETFSTNLHISNIIATFKN